MMGPAIDGCCVPLVGCGWSTGIALRRRDTIKNHSPHSLPPAADLATSSR
jgi:hypothetical protein